MKILSKEYVYEHGIDGEDVGYDDIHGTHVIMDTQIPFNGLLYLSYTRPTYVLAKADKEKQEKFKNEFEVLKKMH